MTKIAMVVLAGVLSLFVSAAGAQSVPGKVTSTVNSLGLAGQPGTGAGASASPALDLYGNPSGSDVPGGMGVKMGDKVIKFRGAVGGDDRSNNAKAGVGIPF